MLTSTTSYSASSITKEHEAQTNKEKMSSIIEKYKERVSTLPKQKGWINHDLYKYQGFWYHQGFWFQSSASFSVEAIMALQDDFRPKPTNIFLASHPKSGTTWLKALAFAIVNRTKSKNDLTSSQTQTHPLPKTSPHDLVPFIERESFLNNPRDTDGLIATHMPYALLPESVISCGCKIVYVCRNPKDVFVSFWHFMNKLREDSWPPIRLEDAFELFRSGVSPNGSCWDHVVGYRKASLERPEKVLLLKYEEMKKDVKSEVKKLAKFMGYPFTEEEEAQGAVEEIVKLCSFEKLREVNQTDKNGDEKAKVLSADIFFRKGEVGDSVNYLTTEMIQILDGITREKLDGLDLSF